MHVLCNLCSVHVHKRDMLFHENTCPFRQLDKPFETLSEWERYVNRHPYTAAATDSNEPILPSGPEHDHIYNLDYRKNWNQLVHGHPHRRSTRFSEELESEIRKKLFLSKTPVFPPDQPRPQPQPQPGPLEFASRFDTNRLEASRASAKETVHSRDDILFSMELAKLTEQIEDLGTIFGKLDHAAANNFHH